MITGVFMRYLFVGWQVTGPSETVSRVLSIPAGKFWDSSRHMDVL